MPRFDATADDRRHAPHELPAFYRGAEPDPEGARQLLKVRGFATVALLLTAMYLVWRGGWTLNLDEWWVSIPLYVAEIHNALGLLLFTLALWSMAGVPHPERPSRDRSIAVLIPTYNEPEEVLLPTIAAAVALEPAHETWVLDDGRREEVRELAERLGARYLTRPDNTHAKAGNLNHALDYVDAELLAIFDADHVPTPNFLRHTLAYFDDERVAVVQTPQDFYNDESFEHAGGEGERRFHEEAVFYRVIAPAKNVWGGAFWCGTCAVVRAAALRDVGGVATETVTEDIHTTIRLNRKGWKAVYHNEVLARGLAPADASEYMGQRNRWALGAMQVLRHENPLFASGLTFGQRLSFATTLFAWFDSWRTLMFMILPMLVLATGAVPIVAPGYIYGPLFLAAFLSQFVALRLLARGYYPPTWSLVFEVLRMPSVLPATVEIVRFWPGNSRFRVTRKGRSGDHRETAPVPLLLQVLLGASVLALLWTAATFAGLTSVEYREIGVVVGSLAFVALNITLLVTAIRRIRASRFSGERRASVRFDVELSGRLNAVPCSIRDVSLTGARVFLDPDAERGSLGDHATLTIDLPGDKLQLRCDAPRLGLGPRGALDVGVRFLPDQQSEIAHLALALFRGQDGGDYVDWRDAPQAPAPGFAA